MPDTEAPAEAQPDAVSLLSSPALDLTELNQEKANAVAELVRVFEAISAGELARVLKAISASELARVLEAISASELARVLGAVASSTI